MFIVNVEAAIHKEGRWLLILRSEKEEHAAGVLSLVGGKCEQEGNSTDIFERTVKREVWEEVGIEVANPRYVNSSSFVTDKGIHVMDIVFLCDIKSGKAYRKSPDEVDAIYWMTTEEILQHEDIPTYLKDNIKLADKLVNK
ncbi:NUDIX domain-containing protein [Caldibacillus lycopersici]|uniref:NUDIX domain-containing protein n=1 Tax=Perspicuibacillus lycopersici TaxID=1325689 RepID=A0AAE3LPD3_9BACI|nr:NUDIX domain-containing protein [Perspicuibacillus lycopersici]MCU9614832.1 NUDIX domain-containing protein [Perspicuibacillus lycopersici]